MRSAEEIADRHFYLCSNDLDGSRHSGNPTCQQCIVTAIHQVQIETLEAAMIAQCVGCEGGPPDKGDPKNFLPPRHGALACSATRIRALIPKETT